MAKNYIIDACCSVDDLRCHLQNKNPETLEAKRELQNELALASQYELEHQGRVTIVKMINAKWRQIQKSI